MIIKDEVWTLPISQQYTIFKTVADLPFSYTLKYGRNDQLAKEL